MGPDSDLSSLLEGGGVIASDSTLHAIAARARRRREHRLKVVTSAAVVVALAGVGFGIAGQVGSSVPAKSALNAPSREATAAPRKAAGAWTKAPQRLGRAPSGLTWSAGSGMASSPQRAAPNAAAGTVFCTVNGCPGSPAGVGALTRLFDRTTGDVSLRAFTEQLSIVHPEPMIPVSPTGNSGATSSTAISAVPQPAGCGNQQSLLVEISNPSAIGSFTVSANSTTSTEPFVVIDSTVVGVAEGAPTEVVAVKVASNVLSVQASFADGSSDEMAAVDGWAVLADDGSSPLPATLTALDTGDSALGTASVSSDDAIAEPTACLPINTPAHSPSTEPAASK